MGKATGFIEFSRAKPPARPVAERVGDYRHVYKRVPGRGAGAPGRALHGLRHPVLPSGLPARQSDSRLERSGLPRFVAGRDRASPSDQQLPRVHGPAVSGALRGIVRARDQQGSRHHQVDRAGDRRSRVRRRAGSCPQPPPTRTWKKVAVIGSGPAGLAAAAQLNRAGHSVTVFEKSDRIGGLLRYGIPEFKMEKRVLDRRLDLLSAEGVVFRTRVNVGVDVTTQRPAARLRCGASCRRRGPAARPRTCPAASSRACTSRWST